MNALVGLWIDQREAVIAYVRDAESTLTLGTAEANSKLAKTAFSLTKFVQSAKNATARPRPTDQGM